MAKKKAFVLMPFKDPFTSYYIDIFKPALETVGFEVSKADDIYTPRPIMDDIRRSIVEADLILCEMTGKNPNVFYELGLAHAIGKPAILITCHEEDIPFDLRTVRTISYNCTQTKWSQKLEEQIVAAAKAVLSQSDIWPSPLLNNTNDILKQNKPSESELTTILTIIKSQIRRMERLDIDNLVYLKKSHPYLVQKLIQYNTIPRAKKDYIKLQSFIVESKMLEEIDDILGENNV